MAGAMSAETPPRARARSGTRLLYLVHSWTGLLTGWLLFAICLTGTLVVYKFPLKAIANPALSNEALPDRIGPDGALARIRVALPDERVMVVAFPSDIYSAHQYSVTTERPDGSDHRSWVSPATGTVRSKLPSDFADFVQRLHAQLFLGKTGRWIVGFLGLVMAVSAGTGLAFHWRRLRRDLFAVKPHAHARKAWSGVHKVGGVWMLPLHLLLALTGAWLGLESLVGITASSASPLKLAGSGPGHPLPIATIVARARAARPDFTPTHVNFENYGAAGSTVRVQGDLPGSRLVQRGQTMLVFDADSGRLLQTIDRTRQGWGRRILAMVRPLHYGYFWPGVSELLYVLLGAAATLLAASGMLIWAERDKHARYPRDRARRVTGMERANAAVMGGMLLALGAIALAGSLFALPFAGSQDLLSGKALAPELAMLLVAWVAIGTLLSRMPPMSAWRLTLIATAATMVLLPVVALARFSPGARADLSGLAIGFTACCWAVATVLILIARNIARRTAASSSTSKGECS